jgi:hypothetical protein
MRKPNASANAGWPTLRPAPSLPRALGRLQASYPARHGSCVRMLLGVSSSASRRPYLQVPAQTWVRPGADVGASRRRRGRIPAQTWARPGADVGASRRRCGRIPAQTWLRRSGRVRVQMWARAGRSRGAGKQAELTAGLPAMVGWSRAGCVEWNSGWRTELEATVRGR